MDQNDDLFLQIYNTSVCLSCFLFVHGISRYLWEHSERVLHASSISPSSSSKQLYVLAWIKEVISKIGDYHPHQDIIILPNFMNWKELFTQFKEDAKIPNEYKNISSSYFHEIRRNYFSKLLKKGSWTSLGKLFTN